MSEFLTASQYAERRVSSWRKDMVAELEGSNTEAAEMLEAVITSTEHGIPALKAAEQQQRIKAKKQVGELVARTNMVFTSTNHAHRFVDRVVEACFGSKDKR